MRTSPSAAAAAVALAAAIGFVIDVRIRAHVSPRDAAEGPRRRGMQVTQQGSGIPSRAGIFFTDTPVAHDPRDSHKGFSLVPIMMGFGHV
eukprot:COSAG01_NODE_27799_length_675_cov_2.329289_1_plen_90_part_00